MKITNLGPTFRALDPEAAGRGRDTVIPGRSVADVSDALGERLITDYPDAFKKGAVKIADAPQETEGDEEDDA